MTDQKKIDDLLAELDQEYPECGFYIGAGWFPVVADALRRVQRTGVPWKLAQVKQKFCGLRVYIDFPDEVPEEGYNQILGIVQQAELDCSTLCESCGKTHDLSVPRFGVALCQECGKEERKDG
jgi:hypothetical protein